MQNFINIFTHGIFIKHAWFVLAVPFLSFVFVGLVLRPLSKKASGLIATLSISVTTLFVYGIIAECFLMHRVPSGAAWQVPWLRYQDGLSATLGVLVDPLSLLLMCVVTTVSALVHLYSIGYMRGDEGVGRYFAFLNLFTFSMLGLVVAPNILQIFIFWELVGVSSFLLIGYYYEKPQAVAASKKAFIVTRFADLGFFIGIFILGYYGFQSFSRLGPTVPQALSPFDFAYLTSPAFIEFFKHETYMIFGLSIFSLTLILVFMGACGKSAMFPLHIWLPDAMEGPTPVSALIHAATMVVAGVYLVARMFPLFVASPEALGLVQCVGTFTCLFAATIGCTQDDIKRVLAFSTLSQIGYMMFALGVCHGGNTLGYTASLFHLFTHAFFKALLFLGAGSIIHALHTNNVWEMGGLVKAMPITHLTFLVATLSISGIPPFSGFFSKDEILLSAFINHQYLTFVIALLVAGLTSFYMFRVYFLTFWSEAKWHGHVHKPQEASWTMTLPLLLLAVLAAISGFTPIAKWIFYTKSQVESHRLFFVPVFGVLVAAFGFLLAMLFYTGDRKIVDHVVLKFAWMYGVIKHKFYIDEVYLWITKKVIFRFIAFPVAWFDRRIVDGGVNLAAWVTRKTGWLLRFLQTGQVQTYGIWLVSGGLVMLLVLLTL